MLKAFLILVITCAFPLTSDARELPLHLLKLQPGYQIEVFAHDLPAARQLAIGTHGTIFVGSKRSDVYAITKRTGQPAAVKVVASGLNHPNGVAFYEGALYVAEINRILRYDDIENKLDSPPEPKIIREDLPTETHHGFRYIRFGPDKKLYIGIGMPCNVCLPEDVRFGTIARMNADGSQFEIYTNGVRNTVGFDWDPTTTKLWFTDNGRDGLGDNIPPDKFNYAPQKGMHFGFPFFNGKGLPDPEYGKDRKEHEFTMPTYNLPAHVAALGMKFYRGKLFPTQAGQQVFIAEHGSWNRSRKIGYQVIRLQLKNNKVIKEEPFVTGWLQDEMAWGRPVDLLELKDGSLLISDDYANVIYRVSYHQAT